MSVEDILNKAKDIGGSVVDSVVKFADTDFEGIPDIKDVRQLGSGITKRFSDIKQDYQNSALAVKPATIDDEDKRRIQTIKDETGGTMTSDILKGVDKMGWMGDKIDRFGDWTGMYDLGGPQYKKGVDRGSFQKNLSDKESLWNAKREQVDSMQGQKLQDNGLTTLKRFIDNKNLYVVSGLTEEEASLQAEGDFTPAELKKLSSEVQIYNTKIMPEIQAAQLEADNLYKDVKKHVEDSVELKEGENLDEILQPKFKGSMKVSSELMMRNQEELDSLIGPNTFVADSIITQKRDKLVELYSNLDLQRLKRLSEADESEYEQINGEYKGFNDAMKKFYLEQFKAEVSLRSKDANWKDDKQLENEAIELAYNKLSESDQEKVKTKKIYDNMEAISVNSKQMKDNMRNGNYLRGAYNAVETLFSTTGLALNYGAMAAQGDTLNTRRVGQSIANADNLLITQVLRATMYNPGDVLNLAASLGGSSAIIKGGATFANLSKALASGTMPKVITGLVGGKPAQFLINNPVSRFVGTGLKYGTEGIVTGMAPNTAIDLAMGEVSTKALDEFNMLTDILFDTGIAPLAKVTYKKTRHDILSDLMFGETKQARETAVKDFTVHLNSVFKDRKPFTEGETKELLREKIIPLYRSTVDKEVADKIFNRGEIYGYVSDILKRMDEDKLRTVLTPDGHIVKVSGDAFREIGTELRDIYATADKIKSGTLKGKELALYNNALGKRIDTLNNWVDGKTDMFNVRLFDVPSDQKAKFKVLVNNISKSDNKTQEILSESFMKDVSLLREKYSNAPLEKMIEVTNALSGTTLKIRFSDLQKLADAQEVKTTTQDLINQGYIDVTQKAIDDTGARIKDAGVYEIRKTAMGFVLAKEKQFYDEALSYIDKAITDGTYKPLLREDGTPVLSHAQLATELASEVIQVLTGRSQKGDTVKGMVTNDFETRIERSGWTIELDKNFILGRLEDILGKENVGEKNLGDDLVSVQSVIDQAQSVDKYFVYTYGTFENKTNQNIGAITYAKYMMPGGATKDTPMALLFKQESQKQKDGTIKFDGLQPYTNKTAKTIRQIIQFAGIKDGKVDIKKGLEGADAVESYNYYGALIKDDGTLDGDVLNTMIRDAGDITSNRRKELGISNFESKQIKDDVIEFLKVFSKEDNEFIGTIAKNLIYKLISNRPLVEALMKKGTVKQKNYYLRQLLLPDNQLKVLAKKVGITADKDVIYEEMLAYELKRFKTRSQHALDLVELDLQNIKANINTIKGNSAYRDEMEIKKVEKEKQKKALQKNIAMDEKEYIKKNLSDMQVNGRFTKIDESIKKAMELGEGRVKTYEGFKSALVELEQRLAKLSPIEKDIVANGAKTEVIDNEEIILPDTNLNEIKDLLVEVSESNFRDVVDKTPLIAEIQSKMDLGVGIFNKKYALENNVLSTYINNSISKKSMFIRGENELLSKFKEHFEGDDTMESFDDMYVKSPKFRELIDGMYFDNKDFDEKGNVFNIGKIDSIEAKKKNFNKVMRDILDEIFKDKAINALDNGILKNIYSELADSLFKTSDIFNQFKAIAHKKKFVNGDGTDIVSISKVKTEDGRNQITKDTGYYAESVITIDKMIKEMGKKISFIKLSDISDLKYIEFTTDGKTKTLNTVFNKLIEDGLYRKETFNGTEVFNKVYPHNLSDVEKADIIIRASSGQTAGDFDLFLGDKKTPALTQIMEQKEAIRDYLNLKGDQIITGTFGDKDSFLQVYDFEGVKFGGLTKQQYFQKEYAEALGYKNKDGKILASNKITKRESATMSNYSTFDNLKLDTSAYILDEVHDGIEGILKQNNKNEWVLDGVFTSDQLLIKIGNLDIYSKNSDLYDDIKQSINAVVDENGLPDEAGRLKILEARILKDFNDGTSFATKEIHTLRNIINGIQEPGSKNYFTDKSFKDHFTGESNGKKFLIKTLFNKIEGTTLMNGKPVTNAIFAGKSSLKLDGGFVEKDLGTVVINGREYKVIGEIEGTTTQNFRNASSDSMEESDEQSVALQILNNLDVVYQKPYYDVLKKELDIVFKELVTDKLKTGWKPAKGFKAPMDMDIEGILAYYQSKGSNIGEYTDSILGGYVGTFLKAAQDIVNRGKSKGELAYMQEVSPYLKGNEVILSQDNPIVANIKKDIQAKIDNPNTPEDIKEVLKTKLKNNDLEIVSYRYPVATKYNLGTYKVIIAEELGKRTEDRFKKLAERYSKTPKGNVIMSPYAVFVKKEGDFDGDHLYMLSSHSEKGEILTRASLNIKMEDDLLEALENPVNKHLVTEQAEGGDLDVTLYEARMIALTAKKNVGTVVSGKRTLELFRQVADQYKEDNKRLIEIQDNVKQGIASKEELEEREKIAKGFNRVLGTSGFENDEESFIQYTIEDIARLMSSGKQNKVLFDKEGASTIQMAVDFAKAGKKSFPSDWANKLAEHAGANLDNPDEFWKMYSAFSYSYKKNDDLKASVLHQVSTGYNLDEEKITEFLYGKLGIKRDLYQDIIDSYFDKLKVINVTNDPGFIINKYNPTSQQAKDIFTKTKTIIGSETRIKSEDKSEVLELFKGYKKPITGEFDEGAIYIGEGKTIPSEFTGLFGKLKTEYDALINSKLTPVKANKAISELLKKYNKELFAVGADDDRMLFALYTLANKNYKIFDLLTANQKVDFIEYTDELNRKTLSKDWYGKVDGKAVNKGNNLEKILGKGNKPEEQHTLSSADLAIKNEEAILKELQELKDSSNPLDIEEGIEVAKINIARLEKIKADIIARQELVDADTKQIKKTLKEDLKEYDLDPFVNSIPIVTFEAETSLKQLDNIIGRYNRYAVGKNRFSQLMIADNLEKIDPELLYRVNIISSYVNTAIDESSKINGISLSRKNKDYYNDLGKYAKIDLKITKAQHDEFRKVIDGLLIKSLTEKTGNHEITIGVDEIIEGLNERFTNSATGVPANFGSSEAFRKTLQGYIDEVVNPTVKIINNLENASKGSINEIKIAGHYDNSDTLFKDVLGASKSDGTFALRTLGLGTDGVKLIERLVDKGMPEKNARKVASLIVPRQGTIEKAIGYINAFHYLTNYGLLSTFSGMRGLVMTTAQLIPNLYQLLSTVAMHKDKLQSAEIFIKKWKLFGNEDMLNLSVGHDLEVSQNSIISGLSNLLIAGFDKAGNTTIGKWTKIDFDKYGKYANAAMSNPLSFGDMPLEGLRKSAALIQFYRTLGLNSTEELEEWMLKRIHEDGFTEFDIKSFVNSNITKHYANSGGGVVSSSQLYRKTYLNTFDLGKGDSNFMILPRVMYSMIGYLNGWAFNLTSQVIDNQLKFGDAANALVRGRIKEAGVYMDDWLSYNASLLYISANALGLYLKLEKYERDPNDIGTAEEFTKSFNNSLVAMEILFGQMYDNTYKKIAQGEGVVDSVGYGVTSLFERYTRTVVFPLKIATTIYDEYKTSLKTDDYETHKLNGFLKFNEIVWKAFSANIDSYLRYNGQKAMEDSFKTITDRTNVSLMGLGGNTPEDDIMEHAINKKNFISYQDKGFWASLFGVFSKPFNTDGKFGITSDRAVELVNAMQKREGIGALITNKGITNDINSDGYNLIRILGDDTSFTKEQQEAVQELWTEVSGKYSEELDAKGRNLFKFGESDSEEAGLETSKMDDLVTTVLGDKMAAAGYDINDVINGTSTDGQGFLKLMALAEHAEEVSAGQVLAYSLYKQWNKATYEYKKANLQKGKDGFYHMAEADETYFKRQVLLKNAELLNLDAETVGTVIDLEMRNNQKDVYANFPKDNKGKMDYRDQKIVNEMNSLLSLKYIATKELQKGDTNVLALLSRNATILRGLDLTNERGVQIVNELLIDIDNSLQDPKTKTAKKAALLMGLDKATYGVLQDNAKFNVLSHNAKKTLANWIYDTSSKAVDYDATNIIKDVLSSASGTGGGSSYPNRVLSDYKKKNFNDARPGFSKQFAPMQKFIPNMMPYISSNPAGYLAQRNQYTPQTYNFYKAPIMQDYFKVKAEVFMQELYSKDIIKAGGTKQELAKQRKKTIILKPKRKVKNPKRVLAPVRIPKASKGLLSDKPFNYD